MNEKLNEVLGSEQDHDSGSLVDPLPLETQVGIMDQVLEKPNGTAIAGVGIKKPPLPRGRSRPSIEEYVDLKEQLRKSNEERAKQEEEHAKKEAEFEQRIRLLEAARFGSNSEGNALPSDSASFVTPMG